VANITIIGVAIGNPTQFVEIEGRALSPMKHLHAWDMDMTRCREGDTTNPYNIGCKNMA